MDLRIYLVFPTNNKNRKTSYKIYPKKASDQICETKVFQISYFILF